MHSLRTILASICAECQTELWRVVLRKESISLCLPWEVTSPIVADRACLPLHVYVLHFCCASAAFISNLLQVSAYNTFGDHYRVMAGQASVVPDLTSDNFDLLRFPSLTAFAHELQTDNDDLSMIARLGSLFDPLTKPAFPASVSPPTSASEAAQPAEQVCQPSPQHMDAGIQLTHTPRAQQPMPFSANSPGYPMLSPRSPRPNPAQMVPRPLMAVSFTLCV